MLTVALSHPSSFLATSTTHVDLFNLPQIAAVITLRDGTAFLANFEQRPVGMPATRTAMPTYADITIVRKTKSASVVIKRVNWAILAYQAILTPSMTGWRE
jgi:hypothetical protein